jgi:hypothetical protein
MQVPLQKHAETMTDDQYYRLAGFVGSGMCAYLLANSQLAFKASAREARRQSYMNWNVLEDHLVTICATIVDEQKQWFPRPLVRLKCGDFT